MNDATVQNGVTLNPDDLIKLKAKELYFEYKSTREIGRAVDVDHSTVSRWIKSNGWDKEREDFASEVSSDAFQRSKSQIQDFWKAGIPFMYNSLIHRIQSKKYLSVPEIKSLFDAFINLEKLWRLSKGEATEILGAAQNERIITIEELKKIIEKDSFLDIKTKEVSDAEPIPIESPGFSNEVIGTGSITTGTDTPTNTSAINSVNAEPAGSGGADNSSPGSDVGAKRDPFD